MEEYDLPCNMVPLRIKRERSEMLRLPPQLYVTTSFNIPLVNSVQSTSTPAGKVKLLSFSPRHKPGDLP